jgi:hypothetical protein
MPYGYRNRISDLYWTSGTLSFASGKWTGGIWTFHVLTPTVELDVYGAFRFVIKLEGAAMPPTTLNVTDTVSDFTLYLPGVPNQHVAFTTAVYSGPVTFTMDYVSVIEILEIEAGYNGTHYPEP